MIVLILLIAMGLRFLNLGITPGGLFVDEASIGYNAYSILETGRDEYGKSFPALIKSFGDYKAPVYTYLLIPIYKIWGMNMATTRAVSAASGVITVLFLYLLVKLITDKKRLAILSGLVLALSPWHILLSRAAFEANVALMFMIIGLWAFFKYLKEGKMFLIIAAISTAVSFTTYHAERIILPLLYLSLGWWYRKELFKKNDLKKLIGGVAAGLIILLPTLLIITTPAFSVRAERVNILGLKTEELLGFVKNAGIFNNRALLFTREWLSLCTAYFSPKYLFGLENSVPRDIYPDVGPFLIWMLPFLIIGVVEFIRLKNDNWKKLLIMLLIISPLPASLVREPFGMIRALPLIIPMSILIAMGIDKFIERWRLLGTITIAVLVLWGMGRIYLSAFKLNDYYRYQYWDWGVDKVVEEIGKLPDKEIQVDGWRAEIYSQLLFFMKYDPAKYQADNKMENLGSYYNNEAIDQIKRMGRITVKSVNWDKDALDDKVIVGSFMVMGDDQIKKYCLTKLFTVRAPDNSILFIGAGTNPQVLLKYKDCRNLTEKIN
jgi:4-amino-4-deoxy-L-arabinose transferase-like glycosyltransferase